MRLAPLRASRKQSPSPARRQFPLQRRRGNQAPAQLREGLVRMVIAVAMVGIIGMTIIAMVVGHRIADGGAAYTANHSADWPADNRPANCARNPSRQRPALIG